MKRTFLFSEYNQQDATFLNFIYFFLCVLDHASSWYLNKGRPTWWYLLYYVNLLLNMFRKLIHPSSGAWDYLVRYITPTRLKSAQYSLHNNAPSTRKLLKMDVLTSETCWAVNWHNKVSVIKLVYLYSNYSIIYFCKTLYMFQTVFPSIIRSSKLHTQRQALVRPLLLPAASGR